MKFYALILLLVLAACSEKKEQAPPLQKNDPPPVTEIDLNAFLADKLVKLEGDDFATVEDFSAPTKYYAFYETASWCGECQKFNSTLFAFYDLYKELYGDQFELVLLSYDNSAEDMLNYAKKNQIHFPHLAFSQKELFAKNVPILTARLPNLIITDTKGRVLKSAFNRTGKYHGPVVAMNYLKSKLEEK